MNCYKSGTQVVPNWTAIDSGDLEGPIKKKLYQLEGCILRVIGTTVEDERMLHYIECNGERFSTPLYFEELMEFKGDWDT